MVQCNCFTTFETSTSSCVGTYTSPDVVNSYILDLRQYLKDQTFHCFNFARTVIKIVCKWLFPVGSQTS